MIVFKSVYEQGGIPQSSHDKSSWTIGEWRSVEGTLGTCYNGLHFFKENGLKQWSDFSNSLYLAETRGETTSNEFLRGYSLPSKVRYGERKYVARNLRLLKKLPITAGFLKRFAKEHNVSIEHNVNDDGIWLIWDLLNQVEVVHGRKRLQQVSKALYQAIIQEYAPEYAEKGA